MASSSLSACQSVSHRLAGRRQPAAELQRGGDSKSSVTTSGSFGHQQDHTYPACSSSRGHHGHVVCCGGSTAVPGEGTARIGWAASTQFSDGMCCGPRSGPLMATGWTSHTRNTGIAEICTRAGLQDIPPGNVAAHGSSSGSPPGAALPGKSSSVSAEPSWKPRGAAGELQALPRSGSEGPALLAVASRGEQEAVEGDRWRGEAGPFLADGSHGTLGTPAAVEEVDGAVYRRESSTGHARGTVNGSASELADSDLVTVRKGSLQEAAELAEALQDTPSKLLEEAQGGSEASSFSQEPQSIAAIVARDREVTKGSVRVLGRWIRKVAGPWVRDLLELRVQEKPALQPHPIPLGPPRPSGRAPMGRSIIQADLEYISVLGTRLQWWVDTWRMPLQPVYDPEEVAAYFVRRPHLVVLRLVQVSVATASMGVSLVRDNRLARRVEQQGRVVDPAEMAQRRKATATKLKNTLVRLGPTFIKVAQSLSARPDIIGPDTAKVLAELQDRLPPFPTEDALDIIEEELRRPIAELFLELTPTPVAAASFGQVYKGRTVDGQEVALKVQRPRVLLAVARDILILRMLLGWLRQVAKMNTDLRVLADELALGLYGELDYRQEAANAALFAKVHGHLPAVDVPRVRMDLTARKVMTMEWMDGERPSDLLAVAQGRVQGTHLWQRQLAKQKLLRLVAIGVESSLVQLLDTGVMHADPHPGNLLLTRQGHVAYLDFGLLTRMDPQHQAAMLAAIAHLVNAEWAALANDLAAMDVLKPTTDRAAVSRALEEAFGTGASAVVKDGLPAIKFGQVTTQLWQIALRFRFRLPPYYTLVLRSLASLEGIGLAVEPDFKVFASAYPYVVRRLLTDNSRASREVLRQLLLTEEMRFRWDRMAAFTASSLQATRAKDAAMVSWGPAGPQLGPEATPPGGSAGLRGGEGAAPSTANSLLELILSREAASARRVILEADVEALARAFVAKEAAPVRARLARALAQAGVLRLGLLFPSKPASPSDSLPHSPTSVLPQPLPPLPSPARGVSDGQPAVVLPSATGSSMGGQGGEGGPALRGEARSESEAAEAGQGPRGSRHGDWAAGGSPPEDAAARMQNKRLWFLVRAAIGRLRGGFFLKLQVLWAGITIIATALVLTLQRILVRVVERLDRQRRRGRVAGAGPQGEGDEQSQRPLQPRPAAL